MLYPDFNDLVTLKKRKLGLKGNSRRAIKCRVQGHHHSPFRGQGLEFDSVREYVIGDDIRNIDWRVTARMDSPHIKLFKEDLERHRMIAVDMNANMRFGTKNTFKSIQAAQVAAFLGWQGLAEHDRISACLFGDVKEGVQLFAPKRSDKSFCTVLKTLSEPPLHNHSVSFEDVYLPISQAAHHGSLIYLISDFMNLKNTQEAVLSRLNKKCDVVFIAINDPIEQSLYPFGTIKFSAQGQSPFAVNTNSLSGREAYTADWKENRKQLYSLTAKLNIPLIELTTESDILSTFLQRKRAR